MNCAYSVKLLNDLNDLHALIEHDFRKF